jgi:hypothetical protein
MGMVGVIRKGIRVKEGVGIGDIRGMVVRGRGV